MRNARKAIKGIGLALILTPIVLGAPSVASARIDGPVSTTVAHRQVVKLERQLREAKALEKQTETYTQLYGGSVGRWVSLAAGVGWPASCYPNLFAIIYRESRGNPNATNSSSGAAGLLQFMPQWYSGQWSFPAFDPYDPEVSLRMGLRLYKQQGWTPWAL